MNSIPAAHVLAKEVPGWLRKDNDPTRVRHTHLDTAASFMIGRCRTCQARKSTETGVRTISGPKVKEPFGVRGWEGGGRGQASSCLASGSWGRWLAAASMQARTARQQHSTIFSGYCEANPCPKAVRKRFCGSAPRLWSLVSFQAPKWWGFSKSSHSERRLTAVISEHYDDGPSDGQARPI